MRSKWDQDELILPEWVKTPQWMEHPTEVQEAQQVNKRRTHMWNMPFSLLASLPPPGPQVLVFFSYPQDPPYFSAYLFREISTTLGLYGRAPKFASSASELCIYIFWKQLKKDCSFEQEPNLIAAQKKCFLNFLSNLKHPLFWQKSSQNFLPLVLTITLVIMKKCFCLWGNGKVILSKLP